MLKEVPEEKLAQLVLLVAGEVGDDQAHLMIHHHHPQSEHLHIKQIRWNLYISVTKHFRVRRDIFTHLTGRFFGYFFLCTVFNTASSVAPKIHYVGGCRDQPRTVATSSLAVRRS
jgi:hypothetical protein